MINAYYTKDGKIIDFSYRAPCTLYELIIEHSLEEFSSYGGWYGGDKYNRHLNSSVFIPKDPFSFMDYGGYGDEGGSYVRPRRDYLLDYYKVRYDLIKSQDE